MKIFHNLISNKKANAIALKTESVTKLLVRVFTIVKSLEVTQRFTFTWINFPRFRGLMANSK